jgi:hypothetical protein
MVGTAPAPAGGTIATGKYWLTSSTYYAQPDAAPPSELKSIARTYQITATNVSWLETEAAPGSGTISETESVILLYATSGTTLSMSYKCPIAGGLPVVLSYTATASSITLFGPDTGQVDVLTKQ